MAPLGFLLTFVSVVVAMVLFRAHTLDGAGRMLHGMAGLDGVALPQAVLSRLGGAGTWLADLGIAGSAASGAEFAGAAAWLLALFIIATRAPNSLEVMRQFEPALHYSPPKDVGATPSGWARWRAPQLVLNRAWATGMAALFVLGAFGLNRVSEFLYWQF
jgi:hypothetical protein